MPPATSQMALLCEPEYPYQAGEVPRLLELLIKEDRESQMQMAFQAKEVRAALDAPPRMLLMPLFEQLDMPFDQTKRLLVALPRHNHSIEQRGMGLQYL